MILQLNPPIPVICPKGNGLAHLIIDEGIEHHLKWVIFLDGNGECWTFSNPDIRAQKNYSQGREYISPFYDPRDVELSKEEWPSCCGSSMFACFGKKDTYYCQNCRKWKERCKPALQDQEIEPIYPLPNPPWKEQHLKEDVDFIKQVTEISDDLLGPYERMKND